MVAELERHHRFSWRHRSEHKKVFIFLFLNMIIVPAFAATAITNLYEIITIGYDNTEDFFRQLFQLNNGNLFLIFVINNAGGTFWAQINCSSLLFKNYLSPAIVMATKTHQKLNEGWRKNVGMMFDWGPHYAYNVVIAAIGIVFHSTIPFIALAVAWDIVMRMLGGAHQIIIFYRNQIECNGLLVDLAMRRLVFVLIFTQLTFLIKSIFFGVIASIMFISVCLIMTLVFLAILTYKKTISINIFEDTGRPMSHQATLDWWNFYKHPLTASSESNKFIVQVGQRESFRNKLSNKTALLETRTSQVGGFLKGTEDYQPLLEQSAPEELLNNELDDKSHPNVQLFEQLMNNTEDVMEVTKNEFDAKETVKRSYVIESKDKEEERQSARMSIRKSQRMSMRKSMRLSNRMTRDQLLEEQASQTRVSSMRLNVPPRRVERLTSSNEPTYARSSYIVGSNMVAKPQPQLTTESVKIDRFPLGFPGASTYIENARPSSKRTLNAEPPIVQNILESLPSNGTSKPAYMKRSNYHDFFQV